jgi:hypothetical protein
MSSDGFLACQSAHADHGKPEKPEIFRQEWRGDLAEKHGRAKGKKGAGKNWWSQEKGCRESASVCRDEEGHRGQRRGVEVGQETGSRHELQVISIASHQRDIDTRTAVVRVRRRWDGVLTVRYRGGVRPTAAVLGSLHSHPAVCPHAEHHPHGLRWQEEKEQQDCHNRLT